MKRKNYDLIICGGGASGLLLALHLKQDSFFDTYRILIIDKSSKTTNDRTWCFWEKEAGPLDHLVHHRWQQAKFQSPSLKQQLDLQPYTYKMIRGIDLYQYAIPLIKDSAQFDWIEATISDLESTTDQTWVHTDQGVFASACVFSSIYRPEWAAQQKKYPVLQQHFVGWVVETENHCFDPEQITFMDFDVPQASATRFMYVLPFASNKALLEDTFFSAHLLSQQEYEAAIAAYLNKIGAGKYSCIEKEIGSIPMTAYPFHRHNTNTLMQIGTAGGWTKASTGYTFQHTLHQIQRLTAFLKTNSPLDQFYRWDKFSFYDLLFLDVLAKHNALGADLFTMMFRKNPVQRIFRFLDNKTHLGEDLKIMRSFPMGWFLKALWKRLTYTSR